MGLVPVGLLAITEVIQLFIRLHLLVAAEGVPEPTREGALQNQAVLVGVVVTRTRERAPEAGFQAKETTAALAVIMALSPQVAVVVAQAQLAVTRAIHQAELGGTG